MNWPMVGLGALIAAVVVWQSRQEARRERPPADPGPVEPQANAARQGRRTPPWSGAGAASPATTRERTVDFKPGTLGLIRAMRWENDGRFLKADDETYLVHEVVVAIENFMHAEFGDAYRQRTWQVPEEVLAAARQALPDHAGTYGGHALAYLLVRAGADDDFVHAHLHPWERLAFTWRKQQLGGAQIAALLREAGLIESMPAAEVAKLDAWIAEPVTALGFWHRIVDALFGKSRVAYVHLRDPGFENDHDQLFKELMKTASPPVAVEDVQQQLLDAELQDSGEEVQGMAVLRHQAAWLVSFKYQGKPHQFTVGSSSTWMEVAPVLDAADRFLAAIGRPDRVFQFQHGRAEGGEWGLFITAPDGPFRGIVARLELPLAPRG
ncbi:MAG TPA: hypothetical protein VFP37_11530 [Steroidobacteraceae bacterium]|nr:hypothetical protein [Steroidobacteraceae bacterium]